MSTPKKNYSYIWIAFIILIFGIFVIPKLVDRYKSNNIVQNDRLNTTPIEEQSKKLMKLGKVPHFEFTNHKGELMSSAYYEGKVYLVEFFFVTCPTICPIMNKNMRQLDEKFHSNPNFGIASISIDERDTTEVLNAHAKELGVQSPHWFFFSGKQKEVFDVAQKFKLYAGANPNAPGGFEHSGLFALIDKHGNIRCRYDEYNNPIMYYDGTTAKAVEQLKEDIQILLNEK